MGEYVDRIRLDQRRALVIGGGRGVGSAAASALAEAGAKVMIADRDPGFGGGAVERISEAGGSARFVQADVLEDAELSGAIEQTVAEYGGLDILVNVAGGAYHTADGHSGVLEQSLETWDLMFKMNLRYVVNASKAAYPHLAESGRGAIVNVLSTTARAAPFESAYGAAKAGLENLTRTLAFEWGPAGIRTNGVAPGPLATERILEPGIEASALDALFVDVLPLQRVARTEDVASVILFLASDLASFVNGATVPVEGGLRSYAPELRTLIEAGWKK